MNNLSTHDVPHLPPRRQLHPSAKRKLGHFKFDHLPAELASVSRPFAELAQQLVDNPDLDGPDLTDALTHLLEAKDSTVRALLPDAL